MNRFAPGFGLVTALVLTAPGIVSAQTCINDLCFRDRTAAGEISLGAIRGGLAVFDYDGDGWLDLLVGDRVNERNDLFRNVPDPNFPGQRTLIDVTPGSGLDDADGTTREAVGVLAADYDNDDDTDVFIIGRLPGSFGLLYRNDGGHFVENSIAAGVRGTASGGDAAGWADFDLDGDLDLIVAHFSAPWMTLFRNEGNGTFSNASSLLPTVPGFTHNYACTWSDFDRDGYPDCLLISNAGVGTEILLRNVDDGQGGRRFENVAQLRGYTAHGPAPMGIAMGDYDNDGDLDVAISDAVIGTFYRNDSGAFTKVQPVSTFFGWGVSWLDADNDGDLDFYYAGSWSQPHVDGLYQNLGGGAFSDASAALNTVSAPTQHSVQVDLNNDGLQELISVVPFNFITVYSNVSPTANHWLTLKLRGDGIYTNRDAIGAFVRLTAGGATQVREIIAGSSTTSTEDLRLHFGLGAADAVERIEITWPRAGTLAQRTEVYEGPFTADQFLTLTPQRVAADLNCDQRVDFFDIDAFVIALFDPAGFATEYPGCNILNGDTNQDGAVNFFDIDSFVELLF